MDERDFAELISVFLKGNDPDKNSDRKEGADTAIDTGSSNESDVRKNIIEALAERIKESREIDGAGAQITGEVGYPILGQDTQDTISLEEISLKDRPIAGHEPEKSTLDGGEPTPKAVDKETTGELAEEEQLVTEEEADQLLNKSEPEEIVTLQQILHRFTGLDGVIAALLVTRDGFIVDYASNIEFELDMVSAVMATGFSTLDKIGHELEQGTLQLAMLEYEQGPVVVAPLVHDIALVVVASQWTTLGRIRWEIKKQSDELVAHL